MAPTLDVIIAGRTGETISVPYNAHEPIFNLIERISHKNGDSQENALRRIFFNSVCVKDLQKSIDTYRVFGNAITYSIKPEITINVISSTGQSWKIKCTPQMDIDGLKEAILDQQGYSAETARFLKNGVQLEDKRKLHEYGITQDSTIHVVFRLRGGGSSITPFIDFADVSQNNIKKVQLSLTAPWGRMVCPGTNIECKCECTDYEVICPKKYGIIELSEEKFQCPICYKTNKIVPITVGFIECKYRFHGIKATGEQYTSDWKTVLPEDQYLLFNPSQQTKWKRLVIESARIDDCENCTICLEPIRGDTKVSCGHSLHSECYSQWNSTCPSCRFNQHLATGKDPRGDPSEP